MANEVPRFGHDYSLARWSDGSRDDAGHLVWHDVTKGDRLPNNNEWATITDVTLNFDPGGEGDFRNYKIPRDRPLNVYGTIDQWPEDLPYFDLDDLAGQAMDSYGFAY